MQCEEKMITHDVPLLNQVRKAGPPVHSWDNQTNTTCGCPSDCKDNLIFEPSIIICNNNENTFTTNNAKEKKNKTTHLLLHGVNVTEQCQVLQ